MLNAVRRPRVTLTAALAALSLLAAWSAPATAQESTSGSSAAVITPLLRLFDFGDTVGMPLACNLASSVVSIAGNQAGASQAASPIVGEIVTQCADLSAKGHTYLQQAVAQSQQLTFINPILNPLIAAMASSVQTAGSNYGPSLAPIGPTIAGLGGTIAFFEG
jgi:hypothetical protein